MGKLRWILLALVLFPLVAGCSNWFQVKQWETPTPAPPTPNLEATVTAAVKAALTGAARTPIAQVPTATLSPTPMPTSTPITTPLTPPAMFSWVQPDELRLLCQNAAPAGSENVHIGSILIVSADSGEVQWAVQSLLPESIHPLSRDDLALIACLRYSERKSERLKPSTSSEYELYLINYPDAHLVLTTTLVSTWPSDAQPSPPSDLGVVTWLAQASSFEVPGVLQGAPGSPGPSPLSLSPDGSLVASVIDETTVVLWDVATQEAVRSLQGHTETIRALIFDSTSEQLFSVDVHNEVIVWDVATGEIVRRVQGPWRGCLVNDAALDPTDSLLATAHQCFTPTEENPWLIVGIESLWDSRSGEVVKEFRSEPCRLCSVDAVAFSPNGSLLAFGGSDGIRLWDLTSGKIAALQGKDCCIESVAFSPDGKLVAAGDFAGVVRLWDVAISEVVRVLEGHADAAVEAVTFSPNGSLVASGGGHYDDTVIVSDVSTGGIVRRLKGHRSWTSGVWLYGGVYDIAFSPDGSLLASAGGDGMVVLWDVASGKPARPSQP